MVVIYKIVLLLGTIIIFKDISGRGVAEAIQL